jgi:hypothetical protein
MKYQTIKCKETVNTKFNPTSKQNVQINILQTLVTFCTTSDTKSKKPVIKANQNYYIARDSTHVSGYCDGVTSCTTLLSFPHSVTKDLHGD